MEEGALRRWKDCTLRKEHAAMHLLQNLSSSRRTININQSHKFWGPTVFAQGSFWYHYFIRSRSTSAAKAISEAIPLALHITTIHCCVTRRRQAMWAGRDIRARSQCPVPVYPPSGLSSMDSQSDDEEVSGQDEPVVEITTLRPYPASPILEGASPMVMNEVASMSELHLGPSSLSHIFPFSLSLSGAAQSKADDRTPALIPSSLLQASSKKSYLHRTPTGKLTEIGPSPLCQEATKSLLEEADEHPGNGWRYVGYRKHYTQPIKFFGAEYKIGESAQDEKDVDNGGTLEQTEFDYESDGELYSDGPSGFPFQSDGPTSDGCSSESSEAPSETFSMYQTVPDSSESSGPFELGSYTYPIQFGRANKQPLTNDQFPENSKQTKGGAQNLAITIPNKFQPLFNPPLRQEDRSNFGPAERPIFSDSYDLARIQFKNRRGAFWNMVNKDLEELFLHASLLFESEFLDLVFCERDEVKTWLDSYGPRLIQRSMQRWLKANEVLRKAGIRPWEISEEVRDIFELMTPQEQAEFIKTYQKLFALVKCSQERLHLTPSEMEHFSRLSLVEKYDFLEQYKTRREEREKIIRRDTSIFTAKLRRSNRDSDELPFANCSSHSLESLNRRIPKKSGWSTTTQVDNFHIQFLQFGMGQEKVGKFHSSPTSTVTYLPSPLFTSPVMARVSRRIHASDEQQTQKRPTVFTGDGRVGYGKRDEVKPTDEKAKSKQVSGLVVQYDCGEDQEECFIHVREISPSENGAITEFENNTVQMKTHAEAVKQDLKQVVNPKNLEIKVLDNHSQDYGRSAMARLSEVLNNENGLKGGDDTEDDDTSEMLQSKLNLEKSPRKEWLGVHEGAKVDIWPTPPPTECSAEGVIPPVISQHLTNLCIESTLQVAPTTPTLTGTKSEPCTPNGDGYRDIFTKDLEPCSIRVDVLR